MAGLMQCSFLQRANAITITVIGKALKFVALISASKYDRSTSVLTQSRDGRQELERKLP